VEVYINVDHNFLGTSLADGTAGDQGDPGRYCTPHTLRPISGAPHDEDQMRPETQETVDEIRQAIGLLRRHL
jgi:hypothetical protein